MINTDDDDDSVCDCVGCRMVDVLPSGFSLVKHALQTATAVLFGSNVSAQGMEYHPPPGTLLK